MAEGVLGLGGGGAASLNQELIDQLKEKEREARVLPLETQIEDISKEGGEAEKIAEITTKANELLETIKSFDLFVSGGITAFDQKSATTSGTSVVFDAVDEASLNTGTTSVTINSLAKRDVFETLKFSDKDGTINGSDSADDTLVITHNGTDYTFETNGKTYQELADEINANENINATIEEVGTGEYRIVIKSAELGTDNALTLQQNGSLALGIEGSYTAANSYAAATIPAAGDIVIDGETFSLDGATESYSDLATKINASATFEASYVNDKLVVNRVDGTNISVTQDDFSFSLTKDEGGKTLSAENMTAIIDGVNYSSASNTIVVDGGLKVTAVETGTSTINVEKDTSNITTSLQAFVEKYNELVTLVDDELYSDDSPIQDSSTLRSVMEGIKNELFDTYGTDDSLSIFNYGFELDKTGHLSLDTTVFNDAVANNVDDLKSLFLGVAEDEGLGTQLKSYLDGLDSFEGLLYNYVESMDERKTSLEEEKEKAIEDLDEKYSLLAQQFASYGTIINQFEAQFSGLKLMIQQSTAG